MITRNLHPRNRRAAEIFRTQCLKIVFSSDYGSKCCELSRETKKRSKNLRGFKGELRGILAPIDGD